jgi:hypothetical protein
VDALDVKTIPVRVGNVEVLVETSPVAGSEPTSAASDAAERVLDVFVRARDTIVELAGSMSDVLDGVGEADQNDDG